MHKNKKTNLINVIFSVSFALIGRALNQAKDQE